MNSLRGHEIVVELKNDSCVRGILDEGDWGLNIVLRNAVLDHSDMTMNSAQMEYLMLSGRSIRLVHLPPTLDFRQTVAQYLASTSKTMKKNQPQKLR